MVNPWMIDWLHISIRLILALVLGGLVGWEREQNNHAAGFRTHILVCVGSALIMLLSIYGFSEFANEPSVRLDPARLAAQAITGIGFLGAGVILHNGFSITGLTTAASLWVVCAVGLAIGAGFYFAAGLTTILVLFNLFVLNKVEQRWLNVKKIRMIRIKAADQPGVLGKMSSILQANKIDLRKVAMEQVLEQEAEGHHLIAISFTVRLPKKGNIIDTIEKFRNVQGVYEVSID